MGRLLEIDAEGLATPESGLFVEAQRLMLVNAGLEPEDRLATGARLVLQALQYGLGHPGAARGRPGIHALDLGEAAEESNPAAGNRLAIGPGQEEAHVRLE